MLVPIAAHAAPGTPTAPATSTAGETAGSVTAKIAALATENEKLTEQFNQAQLTVASARRAAAAAARAQSTAAADLAVAQRALAASLAMQYQSPSFSRTGAIFTSSSSDGYLQKVQSLTLISAHQGQIAAAASAASAAASTAQQQAKVAVTRALAAQAAVAAKRADLQQQIGKYQTMLTTLTATERSAYLGSNNAGPADIALALSTYQIGATPADITAVKTALSELGKPYVWAASGPSSFDCSGLTMVAWGSAGVSLPHLASSQQSMGTPVDRSQLRAGDLVFFGSPAYHVAMYLADGLIIQAPNSGDVVKISPLSQMANSYSGAARFG
jgi:cell wall-associated NlpC family hydrolase